MGTNPPPPARGTTMPCSTIRSTSAVVVPASSASSAADSGAVSSMMPILRAGQAVARDGEEAVGVASADTVVTWQIEISGGFETAWVRWNVLRALTSTAALAALGWAALRAR